MKINFIRCVINDFIDEIPKRTVLSTLVTCMSVIHTLKYFIEDRRIVHKFDSKNKNVNISKCNQVSNFKRQY